MDKEHVEFMREVTREILQQNAMILKVLLSPPIISSQTLGAEEVAMTLREFESAGKMDK